MSACIAGFLLSRMRSGLVCRRRLASSSSSPACASKCAISAARCAEPLGRLAQAVELRRVAFLDDAQLAPQRAQHQDQLGVDVRPGITQRLGAELVELALAALSAAARGGTGPM